MPTTVEFLQTSTHTIQPRAHGGLRYVPAIPSSARLYIVSNNGPYIGTSSNTKDRFKPRLRSLWEMGVNTAGINIELFRIQIGGTSASPDNYGDCSVDVYAGNVWVTTAVDVEHLLIRIYTQVVGTNVRNTDKWQNPFANPLPDALDWSIADVNNILLLNGRIAHNGSL